MTDLEHKLTARLSTAIAALEELHNDPHYCKGCTEGECQTDECWIWRLLAELNAPFAE